MEWILLAFLFVNSTANIVCFFVGAKIGQQTKLNKEISLPNPINTVKSNINERAERKEIEKELEREKITLENVDNYDGTGFGQKDLP